MGPCTGVTLPQRPPTANSATVRTPPPSAWVFLSPSAFCCVLTALKNTRQLRRALLSSWACLVLVLGRRTPQQMLFHPVMHPGTYWHIMVGSALNWVLPVCWLSLLCPYFVLSVSPHLCCLKKKKNSISSPQCSESAPSS